VTRVAEERFDETLLREVLARAFSSSAFRVAVVSRQRLKRGVLRLSLEVDGVPHAVIAKRVAPAVAVRNRTVVERWLPAEGLAGLAPALLGVLPEADATWLVSEDFGTRTLESSRADWTRVEAAVVQIAELHRRFADHPLLAECRLWGGDLGMPFHDANVRDALRAVRALMRVPGLHGERLELCRHLEGRLVRVQEDAPRRAALLARAGGPETLLHGDLWLTNVVEVPRPGGFDMRLIDWDHAAVGPPAYDVSTLLQRFEPADRRRVWADYRAAFGEGAWRFPDEDELASLAEWAEHARIASRVIWPALAALRGEEWAWEELSIVESWFADLRPLFA